MDCSQQMLVLKYNHEASASEVLKVASYNSLCIFFNQLFLLTVQTVLLSHRPVKIGRW